MTLQRPNAPQTALALGNVDTHTRLDSGPWYRLGSPCTQIFHEPFQTPSHLHLNTGLTWVTVFQETALPRGFPSLYSPKQKNHKHWYFSKLHTLGHEANTIGSWDRITYFHAGLEQLMICSIFIPLDFPIDLRAKVNCIVIHNWFFLIQAIGQALVVSTKCLFGKGSRFLSLTLLISFWKDAVFITWRWGLHSARRKDTGCGKAQPAPGEPPKGRANA